MSIGEYWSGVRKLDKLIKENPDVNLAVNVGLIIGALAGFGVGVMIGIVL